MRVVIKVGSSVLEFENFFEYFARDVASCIVENKICIVSSGAILTASRILKRIPKSIEEKQIFAAIGQPVLMQSYIQAFKKYDINVAQVLLTKYDFSTRTNYLSIKKTIEGLIEEGIIPVINENDSVATDEIKFGDNDIISAFVATKLMADKLIILTDVDGLIKDGSIVRRVYSVEAIKMPGAKKFLRHGGFASKIMAARMCMESGVECIVAKGYSGVVSDILAGKEAGTLFVPYKKLSLKKRWILFHSKSKGRVYIDEGACKAIRNGKSLLPKGILGVDGSFERGSTVDIFFKETMVGRGITRYSSADIRDCMGKKTYEVKDILRHGDEIIDAHELVII